MSLNYSYLAELGHRLCEESAPKALDYGCGAGQLVELAKTAGFDCIGVETFYDGGSYREDARERGLLDTVIFELKDGRIPQADNSFDIIFSNQVFEHIDDFTAPLREIDRVLKPGGLFINAFPTRDVWREGHCGIPFLHWFPKGTRFPRYQYTLSMRTLGLGFNTEGKSRSKWAQDMLAWLDNWTFYKSQADVETAFSPYFDIELYDADYFAYRLENSHALRIMSGVMRWRTFKPLAAFLARKLAGRIFVMRKRQ